MGTEIPLPKGMFPGASTFARDVSSHWELQKPWGPGTLQATLPTNRQRANEGSVCQPDRMDADGQGRLGTQQPVFRVGGLGAQAEILGSKPGWHVKSNQIPLLGACSGRSTAGCAGGLSGSQPPGRTSPVGGQGQPPGPQLTSVTFPWASRTSLSPTNSSYLSHHALTVEDARC